MFHFKRRTLWIIIYITIPLVIILNSFGPETETTPTQAKTPEAILWSLDDMTNQCLQNYCALALPSSQTIQLSAILQQVPTQAVDIPAQVQFATQNLGGKFVAHWAFKPDVKTLNAVIDFAQQWLPNDEPVQWVASGEFGGLDLTPLWTVEPQASNQAMAIDLPTIQAMTVLDAPSIGTSDQLAFLMWSEVLKRRLAGYQIQLRWDHRAEQSRLLINSTVAPSLFYPVTAEELDQVVSVYMAAANQRMRDQAALHRYAVNASVYGLNFQYFVQQPDRLQKMTLADVNYQREQTFGQVSKN